jgi:hypothetical protein
LSPELELERVVSLAQAADLAGMSKASIKRHHSDKIIRLTPRRKGMKVKHALSLRLPAA